jgi:outer membrane receptor for ferric coprogen and ferric-rhodotorulic acid
VGGKLAALCYFAHHVQKNLRQRWNRAGRVASRTYNIAVRKELFDKKGSLTVGVNNLFNRQLVFRNDFATDRFEFASDSYFYNRTVRVAFNYRFGKLENRPARPKKSISNDDQKAGG